MDGDSFATVPTLGEALRAADARLFVGRERERAAFRDWLAAGPERPSLLAVVAPGGAGKSTLLREFARIAATEGQPVLLLDGRSIPLTAEGLRAALADVAGEQSPLLLFDAFEELAPLRRLLSTELLPRLPAGTGVVIASRFAADARTAWGGPWPASVRTLMLESLDEAAAHELLHRRGLTDPAVCAAVLAVAGGHPLALVLAADLALQFGARAFGTASEWPLVVRELVERMLADIDDPVLRDLLDAAAVVRQFDEATLAAVSGRTETAAAFARLCHLAIVRPAEHGLALHDDVRRLLAADLRWRRPDRFADLRLRALTWLRERMQTAAPDEQAWLLGERLYLCGHALVQSLMFRENDPGEVWVETAGPDSAAEVFALWRARPPAEQDDIPTISEAILAAEVACPHNRIRIARARDGHGLGFSIMQPLCQEVLAIHPVEGAIHGAARVLLTPEQRAAPPAAGDAAVICITNLTCIADERRVDAQAALLRDIVGSFVRPARYVAITRDPAYERLLQAACFTAIAGSESEYGHPGSWSRAYALDLSWLSVDAWISALISGDGLPRWFPPGELESELLAVLRGWPDDETLASSPLVRLAAVLALPRHERGPDGLRRVVRAALAAQLSTAPAAERPIFRAVELAYLTPGLSHEAAAERLAVSRATFYRHLGRGVRALAAALAGTR